MIQYSYCSGTTTQTVNVSMSAGACAFASTYVQGGDTIKDYFIPLTFTLSQAIIADISPWYEYDLTLTQDGVVKYTGHNKTSIYMFAGITAQTLNILCKQERWVNGNESVYDTYVVYDNENHAESTQVGFPVCNPSVPEPGCSLDIISSSVSDVSIRGLSDGTITIYMSGATGQTIEFKLNGDVVSSATTSGYTYTGLTAGVYQIFIVDVNGCFSVLSDVTVVDGEFRTGNFLVTSPSGVTAVENPIIIDVRTAINNPTPLPSITTLSLAGTIADGLSLTFNLTSPYIYNQVFYAKGYPSKPNFFLASQLKNQNGVNVGSNTLSEICTSLSEVLQNDILIPKVYYVNNTGTVVTLQAKETGSKFDLSASNVIASATGVTVSQTQAGVDYCDGQITDNYSISCEVMVNVDYTNQYPLTGDTSDFNRVAELTLPFNPNNVHKFDIGGILKSQVSTPVPDMTLTGSTILPSVMQPWYVKLNELYPLVPNTQTVKKRFKTSTPIEWTMNSSLDRFAINDMSDYVNVPVSFLTNSPNPKQIERNSNEFLYFVLPKNYGTDLRCKGNLYFYDGTSVTGVTYFTISTGLTNAGGCMVMNLSYDKLGLAAYEVSGMTNRKIKRVEVAIYASGGTLQYTEKKIFRIEIDSQPRKFGIFFQNALGMYDSFDFVGVVEETISRETSTYTVPLDFYNDGSLAQGFKSTATYGTKVVKKVTVNTGWIDETHLDWLLELLKTNNVYSTSTTNQNYLNIVGYQYKKSSLDDLFDAEFTFDWTIFENAMTV